MGYKIIDRLNTTSGENGLTKSVCAIYCDSSSDLPTSAQILSDGIDSGSWAWLANDETFATLKTDGTWKINGGR